MRIYQSGASEIYLDGKLIHQFGKVHPMHDSVEYFNSGSDNLSFPVVKNTIHTLAIRFANVTSRFPIWSNKAKSFLLPWVTTFENGNNDYVRQVIKKQSDFGNIALGVIILLAVLFFSLFLFFPAVKVNLYFTLSNVSFFLFIILGYWQASYYGNAIWPGVLSSFFVLTYIMLFLFCLYKIFHQKVGWVYWILVSFAFVNLLAGFFIYTYVSALILILVLADMLRICIRCLKTNSDSRIHHDCCYRY